MIKLHEPYHVKFQNIPDKETFSYDDSITQSMESYTNQFQSFEEQFRCCESQDIDDVIVITLLGILPKSCMGTIFLKLSQY